MSTPLERAADALKRAAAGFLTIEGGDLAERFWIDMADAALTAAQVPDHYDTATELRIANILTMAEKIRPVQRRQLVQRAAEMMGLNPDNVVVGVRPDASERYADL